MSRFLPAASTLSTARPRTSTRASCANTVSNRVTVRPASAACSVRAARWMVSPSGMPDRRAHLHAHRRRHESLLGEERRERRPRRRLFVDLADEQRAASAVSTSDASVRAISRATIDRTGSSSGRNTENCFSPRET